LVAIGSTTSEKDKRNKDSTNSDRHNSSVGIGMLQVVHAYNRQQLALKDGRQRATRVMIGGRTQHVTSNSNEKTDHKRTKIKLKDNSQVQEASQPTLDS
jgi:hypothetical protein